MLRRELRTIEETGRSQVFFANRERIKVERYPELDKIVVRLPGSRQKLIGGRPLAADDLVYYVTMTTVPRNMHNPYGIVVIEITLRQLNSLKQIDAEDFKVEQEIKRKAIEDAKGQRRSANVAKKGEANRKTR